MQLRTFFRHMIARQLERRVQKLIADRKLKVVAVTGSYGKTSTKIAIAEVLKQKYRVLAHQGNFNSEIGLPLSIFEMNVPETLTNPLAWWKVLNRIDKRLAVDYPYDVLVLELGVDQPGEMGRFMRYLTPDIGIVTAIGPVHLEQFGSVDAIAKEKMTLPQNSKAVLLNAEDLRVMKEAERLDGPVQTYGVESGGVRWESVKRSSQLSLSGSLILNDGQLKVQTQFVGRHSLLALAAAAAVGEELGLDLGQLKTGIESATPFAGRMSVFDGLNGSTILDDTYNAAPNAVMAALQTLGELPGRHIAILGSMNELGEYAEKAHREVGAEAKDVDMLVTIGKNASKYTAAGAAEAGMPVEQIHTFDSPYGAGEFVKTQLKKGDVVLAKGSQNGVFAEEAAALLLANPADRAKLVRQSDDWQAKKRAQFADAPSA